MKTNELKQLIAKVTGTTPKSIKDCSKVWYSFLDRNNQTVCDYPGWEILESSPEYVEDGVTFWYNLYVLSDNHFMIVHTYDGGNIGYGHKINCDDRDDILDLFQYFYM